MERRTFFKTAIAPIVAATLPVPKIDFIPHPAQEAFMLNNVPIVTSAWMPRDQIMAVGNMFAMNPRQNAIITGIGED